MIFRQLFDGVSGTYSYLLASRRGGEALIIDPVLEKVDRYLQLVHELDLKLVKAVDTHLHADHITGLGALRDRTRCITVMGEQSKADVVSMRLAEGDKLTIEGLGLDVLYTPGHTDNSYSFVMGDRVFTGDTLLIRGTGRTDFQNGDPRMQYESLFGKLLKLPDETLIYPAHDYKGETVSTIGEEKRFNPRLQVKSADEYVELMNNLHLPNPKMMDVAVPANLHVGLHQEEVARRGWAVTAATAQSLLGRPDIVLIDLREKSERDKHGVIPGSVHAPYPELQENIAPGGLLHALAAASRQAHRFLLRVRRALGDGGAGGAGCRAGVGLPHRRRRRRVEKGGRAAETLTVQRRGATPLARNPVQCKIWLRNSFVRSCFGLAKNSSGAFISTIWPSSMKITRSATWRAKPISWVTTSMVMPSSASSTIVSSTSLTISGSSAEVGSSNSMIFGFMHSARAIATRCCWPPESWPGYLSACSGILTRSR